MSKVIFPEVKININNLCIEFKFKQINRSEAQGQQGRLLLGKIYNCNSQLLYKIQTTNRLIDVEFLKLKKTKNFTFVRMEIVKLGLEKESFQNIQNIK